ncbi:co-chaperone GroES [Culicoidibacter larvae]|uniref:Co-chaperonin GroES n=1 Tax=Culicoidibacter larvae TaxID=2579976 RepID=A0A5R8QCA5_9FIRM|nr:co-chaperone GroES [Culicoidibacter larvae]TLG73906.1 co-chaperone GroES [Culicoidibacter larvae]
MIQPLYDKVVIEVKEVETTTASGIVLTESAGEKSNAGVVVAVGTGRVLENGTVVPLAVEVGQTILFSKFAGTEAKYEGKEYLILSEKDILAIVK